MGKDNNKEKNMIAGSISRRPYGAKLSVVLDDSTRVVLDGEVCLLTDTDYIVKMRPHHSTQADSTSRCRAWDILIEGFATAGEAERKGLEITFGILWGAISARYSVRLQYETPLPCIIYDRTRSGSHLSASATCVLIKPSAAIANAINDGLASEELGNAKLLLAMELFASARQELTERSRFIGLVSSLEPLAEQKIQCEEVVDIVNQFKDQVKGLNIPRQTETSLLGRIEGLATESVSSSIRHLIEVALPGDKEALNIVEDAYNLRSRILHEGTTDADLNQKSRGIESVIRRVIAYKAGLTLRIK
jgi:hypothetical protein